MWDLSSGAELSVIAVAHARWVHSLSWSPYSRAIASAGGWDPYIKVWDAATGALRDSFTDYNDMIEGVLAVCFAPNGQQVASGSRDNSVRVWDTATGALTLLLAGHDGWVTCLAYAADGALLV